MSDLPPALEAFASLLDAQSWPVREAFQYCVCLLMVEADKMRLIDTIPGETTAICVFETVAGERFSVPRPTMDEEQEAKLIEVLREFLREEGII